MDYGERLCKDRGMKILKDLLDCIQDSGGKLIIGDIEFARNGGDIDLKINGELVAWLKDDQSEKSLAEVVTSVSSSYCTYSIHKEKDNKSEELIEMNREKDECIKDLNKKIDIYSRAEGKIEAYEKILMGRSVTISA